MRKYPLEAGIILASFQLISRRPYAFTPRFISGPLLKKYGFKATFIAGILTYTAGCLVFWPAGTLGTFPGFIVAAVILGVGIAT